MRKLKIDWLKYLNEHKVMDYMIIDPPWNFDDKSPKAINPLKYDLWRDNEYGIKKIFKLAKASYLFIWVPNSLLDVLLSLSVELRKYKYKTLITWVKLTSGGKYHYGLGHWLRNSTEQLVVFSKEIGSYKSRAIRLTMRNVYHGVIRPKTGKPRDLELSIIEQLSDRGYNTGAYVFSGTEKMDCFSKYEIDLIDMEFTDEV